MGYRTKWTFSHRNVESTGNPTKERRTNEKSNQKDIKPVIAKERENDR